MTRKMARTLMNADHCLFGQRIPGSLNTVADQLSFTSQTREGKINLLAHSSLCNTELTDRCHALMPQLIPEPFVISQLPEEILSFVVLVLRTMESSMTPSAKQLWSARTGHGVVGSVSATPPESISHSSIIFSSRNKTHSSDHSSPVTRQQTGNSKPVHASTVQNAANNLALHVQGSTQLLPSLRSLFRTFDNIDPPPKRQKALVSGPIPTTTLWT
jgi:hypothetical protein